MSGLEGDISKIRLFEQAIKKLPTRIGAHVAARSAPVLTRLGNETFDAQQNAYGDAWVEGSDGEKVTLVETGALKTGVRYVATGTTLRAALTQPYARYQIGKRPVFPHGYGDLPVKYLDALSEASSAAIDEFLAVEGRQ